MEEAERFCHRALLLKDGTAEAYGTIDEIRNNMARNALFWNLAEICQKKSKI